MAALTDQDLRRFAESISRILLSHAAHGLATHSLEGTGEITLRDGLLVAAAAFGSQTKHAWIYDREVVPKGWKDTALDLELTRLGKNSKKVHVGAIELKWWRRSSTSNAANRRREIVRDFLRAGARYRDMESFAFVALLATNESWSSTVGTRAKDSDAMKALTGKGTQKWNVSTLWKCPAVKGAATDLIKKTVPVCNVVHSELLSECAITLSGAESVTARVWKVIKPQNSRILSAVDVQSLSA